MNSLPSGRFVCICWICGQNVDLNNCNTDEDGGAVHEACYSLKMALEKGARKDLVTPVRFKGEPI